MIKCDLCSKDDCEVVECSICGSVFCDNCGSQDNELCEDCIAYNELKENFQELEEI